MIFFLFAMELLQFFFSFAIGVSVATMVAGWDNYKGAQCKFYNETKDSVKVLICVLES